MKLHKNIENLNLKNPLATIGMFDGVHKGHMEIIKTLKKTAREIGGESVVITFWPHPRMIFEGNNSVRLLTTMDEKASLMEKSDIDHLVIIPFNREFANLSYKKFVKNILVDKIKIKTIIVGYDHQFGKNREGNFEKLLELAKQYTFHVNKLDAQIVENEKVSSSLIREALQQGNIENANGFLGYAYHFTGYVVEGKKKGRSIGYPTANLILHEAYKLIPGKGVYAVKVKSGNNNYNGMMNIGYRPTIVEDNKQKTIEVHIFDYNKDLYGKELTVILDKKIRDEKKFDSIDELIQQLKKDEAEVRQYFS